jgi:hypothetical protein
VVNDRIRKIAIEADAWCDKYYFGDKFYDIEWEKKFAELIVQECINCAEWVGRMNVTAVEPVNTAHAIVKRIEKHFGVKNE